VTVYSHLITTARIFNKSLLFLLLICKLPFMDLIKLIPCPFALNIHQTKLSFMKFL